MSTLDSGTEDQGMKMDLGFGHDLNFECNRVGIVMPDRKSASHALRKRV